LNTEHFAPDAYGFVTAPAEFTLAAEQVGLDGDVLVGLPIFDRVADGANVPGNFSAGRPWKRDLNRQTTCFEPEIEMVQAAGLDLHNDLVWAGLRFGQIAQLKFSRRAVGDKLDGFHVINLPHRRGSAE
jgi:hypothetical protein